MSSLFAKVLILGMVNTKMVRIFCFMALWIKNLHGSCKPEQDIQSIEVYEDSDQNLDF